MSNNILRLRFLLIILLFAVFQKADAQSSIEVSIIKGQKSLIVVYDVTVNAGLTSGTIIANTGTVTTINAAPSQTNTINYVVVLCPTPTIHNDGSLNFCAGGSVTLTAVDGDVNDAGTAWQWYRNNIAIEGATGTSYVASLSGEYKVAVTNTCAGLIESGTASITVNSRPTALLAGDYTICSGGTSTITLNVTGAGIVTVSYSDGTNIYTSTGPAGFREIGVSPTTSRSYSIISVLDENCSASEENMSGTATITVNPLPSATISGSEIVCQGDVMPQVVFTGAAGTAPYTFYYEVNNGGTVSITTVSANSVSMAQTTASAGTFTYTLISVKDASSTGCVNAATGTATIVVNPTPSGSILGNAVICKDAADPGISFTGSGGTLPYTFNYRLNGILHTVETVSGNTVTITQSSSIAGTYTYTLVSVRDGSASQCVGAATGTVTIVVNDLPNGSISGTATRCPSTSSTQITFTASTGVAPFVFAYQVNGGTVTTITASTGNSVTIGAPTNVTGVFSYNLVSITDGNGCMRLLAECATVTVEDNEPPNINCPSSITASTASNGCTATVSFSATASDNCSYSIHYYLNYGSGNQSEISSPYAFPRGVTAVTAKVVDAGNHSMTCSFNVTVADHTAPSITNCPPNLTETINTGCSKVVSWTAPIVSDNCSIESFTSSHASGSSFPVGTTTVTYSAVDIAGNTTTCTFTVTIIDAAPPVISGFTATPAIIWPPDHKMKPVHLDYSITEACTYTTTLTISSNEPGTGTADGDKSPDWQIVDDDDILLRAERGNGKEARVYTIRLTVTDAGGNTTSRTTEVRIAHNITGPVTGTPFKIGSTVNFAGVFWDKAGNKHTANWLIDDVTSVKGSVTEPSGIKNGKVSGSYKFSAAGVYKVRMNVTDQNKITSYTDMNEDLEAIVVVYDPNGGFVYGGGEFSSPAGALTSDPSATGKVSYGFTVNYFKGATYPKGETQFEFKNGELEYNALNFEYLSIEGARAQFKGSGRIIGGQSGINFVMTVIDGQLDGTGVDKIRMKIYNKNTGAVYYDNEPAISEAANPVTKVGNNSFITIGGSNIINNKGKSKLEVNPAVTGIFRVTVAPNPSSRLFRVTTSSDDGNSKVELSVYDLAGRLVEKRITWPGHTEMIGENYKPGVYYLRLKQEMHVKNEQILKIGN